MGRFDFTKDLQKGERFSFTKDSGLNRIQVDLTWLPGADLDACAFLLGEDGIIEDDANFVYFKSNTRWLSTNEEDPTEGDFEPYDGAKHKNKKLWRRQTVPVSKDGSVIGAPDDLGDGDEDDDEAGETMYVVLDRVHEDVKEIVFCVAIATEGVTFKDVRNPAILITDSETGDVLCRYNLKEKFSTETAVEAGKLVIDEEGDWSFEAIGEGHDGGIATLADIYA